MRASSYILSLAREDNYSIHSLLALLLPLTSLNILGTRWQVGYHIVQKATFTADMPWVYFTCKMTELNQAPFNI